MKTIIGSRLWLACLLAGFSGAVHAQASPAEAVAEPVAPAPEASAVAPSTTADASAAAAIVGAFHANLRDNWRQGVLDLLAPDVAIFEQGYTESSRDVYAGDHLDNDLLFASTTKYEVVRRESFASGDAAWVITQARTTGTFAGEDVDIDNTETMILQRRNGKWQIVHIHWSAHPRAQ